MKGLINISFKIHYQAQYSLALYISGSSNQLGCWDPLQAIRLNWFQGNTWATTIINIPEGQFDYKFFVAKYDNPTQEIRWEQGPNRSINTKGYTKKTLEIVDVWEFKKVILRLFESTRVISCQSPDCSAPKCASLTKQISFPSPSKESPLTCNNGRQVNDRQSLSNSPKENTSQMSSNAKSIKENTASISPEKDNLIKERYYVTANIDSMGNMIKIQKMKKSTYRTPLNSSTNCSEQKEIVYWEKQFLVKSSQQNLKYKYAYKSQAQVTDQIERKSRTINFSKNDVDFQGAFCMSDRWLMKDFSFDQITNNISLGPYPENQEQIKQLSEVGVKAVFNLQTEEDMEYHGTNWESIKQLYSSHGIKVIHFPVTDMDVHEMALKLRDAVEIFSHTIKKYNIYFNFYLRLLNNEQHVYIHCTSGIYRSPQVIVAYLHLYQGIDINQAIFQVEAKRPITKKNRDYLRQVYAIKGGYGNVIKQQNTDTIQDVNKSQNSPITNDINQLRKLDTKVSEMSKNLQQITLIHVKSTIIQQKLYLHKLQQKEQFVEHNQEALISNLQDNQPQYSKSKRQLCQQNLLNNHHQQQQQLLSQNGYQIEDIQYIKRKYLKEQSTQLSSFHISFQNLSVNNGVGFRQHSYWNEQSNSKELQRRRHSLLNCFQYECSSPQLRA